jgi:hypothetical protein
LCYSQFSDEKRYAAGWPEPGEELHIGRIPCGGSYAEHIELIQIESGGIRVTGYLPDHQPRELPEPKLAAAVAIARERLAG